VFDSKCHAHIYYQTIVKHTTGMTHIRIVMLSLRRFTQSQSKMFKLIVTVPDLNRLKCQYTLIDIDIDIHIHIDIVVNCNGVDTRWQ